jgi:hypothetical protein
MHPVMKNIIYPSGCYLFADILSRLENIDFQITLSVDKPSISCAFSIQQVPSHDHYQQISATFEKKIDFLEKIEAGNLLLICAY